MKPTIEDLERQLADMTTERNSYKINASVNKERAKTVERQLAEALGMLREAKCPNRCIDGVMPRTNLCEAGDVDQCQWCAMRDAAIGKSQVASEPPTGKLKAAPESPGNPESPKE